MTNKILILIIILTITIFCKKENTNKKSHLKFGTELKMILVDTNKDDKKDAYGYYINDPGYLRLIYEEIDKNLDGISDVLMWSGLHTATPPGRPEQEMVKVHEEEDTNFDGKIDVIRWMLPNDYPALAHKDSDNDGYFETTSYYNFQKNTVRTEIDTNFDGTADMILWNKRAELDLDFDKTMDNYLVGESSLSVEEKAKHKKDLLPLKKENSWFHNPILAPKENRPIIGSGYYLE